MQGQLAVCLRELCNEDRQKTAEDDVFDLAELCWTLAKVEGWEGKDIARELCWSDAEVSKHKAIKEKLHPKAWGVARISKDSALGNNGTDELGKSNFPFGKWQESHFRAFLSILPCPNGDRSVMRSQVSAIKTLMAPPKNDKDKLTAKRAGDVVQEAVEPWSFINHHDLAFYTEISCRSAQTRLIYPQSSPG